MPKSSGEKFSVTNELRFTDADAARAFLEASRWPEGPVCPHCGSINEAYKIDATAKGTKHARKGLWKCALCEKQFTVTIDTIFEDSHIPLNKWLLAIHLLCSSKKGMSAHQLHRLLGVTYKSAWFMAHRIRYAMSQEPLSSKLSGTVEVDETYIGGKERGKRGVPNPEGKKTAVITMVERKLVKNEKTGEIKAKGTVRSRALPNQRVTAENLRPILQEHIESGATLNTDEAVVYYFNRDAFAKHETVNHSKDEYVKVVDGLTVTTNTVEGYFGNLKRGINGVYHHVGKQHLHRYLAEFDFRYNAREVSDADRRDMAIAGTNGKRLKYRDSCGKTA
jgi:transposase-like protein